MKEARHSIPAAAAVAVFALAAALALAGCPSSGGPDTPPIIPDDPVLTGTVSVDGIEWVGQTLTADIGRLSGTEPPSFRWERGSGSAFAPIPGAEARTYVLTAEDEGLIVRVSVGREGHSNRVAGETAAAVIPRPASCPARVRAAVIFRPSMPAAPVTNMFQVIGIS